MSAKAKPALIRGSARPDCLAYLYCILEPGSPAHQQLARRELAGLDPDEPLFPVEAADLVAAVSYVPADVFQEKPLNELISDLARLAPYAVRHEAAISQLATGAPGLVPMGFGAVYRDRERVAAVLIERADEFQRMLDRVRGRLEWVV